MRYFIVFILITLLVSCSKDQGLTPNDLAVTELIENATCTSTPPVADSGGAVPGSGVQVTVTATNLIVGPTEECLEEEVTLEASTEALLSDFLLDFSLGTFTTTSTLESGGPIPVPTDAYRPRINLVLTGPSPGSIDAADDSFSAGQAAQSELLNALPDEQQYQPIFEIKKITYVNSVREMEAKLGVHGKFLFGSFESSFEYSSQTDRTYLMVVLGQQRVKFVADLPTSFEFLDLSGIAPTDDCVVMLKSVIMGGMHILLFEAANSATAFRADLEAAVNGLFASGGGSLSVAQQTALEQTTISSFTLGGVDAYSVSEELPTSTNFQNYVFEGSTFDKHSIGVPLSYEFVYLDGTPYRALTVEQITRRTCSTANIYNDHLNTFAGTHPGWGLEEKVVMANNSYKVITGLGVDVKDEDINNLWVQTRELYADGTLGPREEHRSEGTSDNPILETVWQAENGRVLVTMGGGVRSDDFRTLKVVTARPELDPVTGQLRLVDFRTEYFGSEADESWVEAYCEPVDESMQQVVRGVGMRVRNNVLTTIKLWVSTLE